MKNEFQQQHDIIIGQAFRLLQKAFQHFSIVIPLMRTILITVAVLNVMWIWNDYLLPSLIINKPGWQTLPLKTYLFFGQFAKRWDLASAGLIMCIIPIIIFYLCCQKYIVKGITDGAIK